MSPLSPSPYRGHIRPLTITTNDNGGKGLSRSDWSLNWDYSDVYETNGEIDIGQKDTIGLSTESPLYFMEFYSQGRINKGSISPTVNPQTDYSNQLPNTFDFMDRELATPSTTTRSSPISLPESPKIFKPTTEHDTIQQLANSQAQQRTYLLTTLLPICIIIVILLAVALAIVWYLKFRGGASNRNQRKLDSEGGGGGDSVTNANFDGANAERVPLKEDKKAAGKKNGLTIANNGSQLSNKTPKKTGNVKDVDEVSTAPSKPLIFPNEKPPLKPPDLMTPMAKSAVDPPFQPRIVSTGSPNTRHYYAMGQRPDPYRNLPPPIDARFGLPRQMAPPYGPYRRDPAV